MAAPKTQVNSATGLMGVTGSGKSSLCATLAKYVFRRWGKVTLYYTSDGGGFPAEVQACIAAGIMRVFRMYTRDPGDGGLAFETCQRSCQGWWPKRINPATGEVAPGVEMVPPVTIRFEMSCAQGHVLKTVPSESLLQPTHCPTCNKMTTKADMRVRKTMGPTPGFEQVGAYMYDGLTSMLAWEMREMGHRAGRLELRGEEAAIGGKVKSGDLTFGGSTRSHVGFVQARGEELVHLTLGIPNLVVPPIFTMLTHEDVDERSLSIIGPKIVGRAKTDEAPQWFGNMLEAAKIPALQGSGEQRILYLSEFTDPRGVRHLCKHRGSPGTMPAYLIDPPEDDTHPELAFTGFNLGVFFELLDGALDRRIAQVMAEFPTAPGVPDGIVEVGDSTIHTMPPVLPAALAPAGSQGAGEGTAPVATAALRPKVRKATTAAPAVPALPPVPMTQPVTPIEAVATQSLTPTPPIPSTPPPTTRPLAAPPAGTRPGTTIAGPGVARPTSVTPRPPAAAPRPPTATPKLAGGTPPPVPPSTT